MPVHDLAAARAFYGDVLGCPEGRSAPTWVDFDLYGHQFVAHLDHATRPIAERRVPTDLLTQRGRRPRRAGSPLRRAART